MQVTVYYSHSCGYCRRLLKVIDSIEQERTELVVTRVEHKPAVHTDITFLPTVVVKEGNLELGRFSSSISKKSIDHWFDQLEEYIQTHLGKA